jgi:hypothetical protein
METNQLETAGQSAGGSPSDRELAAFVVDALLQAGLLAAESVGPAVTLVAEELLVRRLSGEIQYS